MISKSDAKRLRETSRDFIPGGKPVENAKDLAWEPTPECGPVLLCGARTGDDIQSGPYYCGDIADYSAPSPGGRVSLCTKHYKRLKGLP